MLRNMQSPETYFQTAFRAQSPWEIAGDDNEKIIPKPHCYVLDFAPERALRQIAEYSCSLDPGAHSPESKVADFVHYLPVIAFDGYSMREIEAREILDFAMSGTTATLLARRWESALLGNVDNEALKRLMGNKQAMDALEKIESFRGLNTDLGFIINTSEGIKNRRKGEASSSGQDSKEEKEARNRRREFQKKLIKLATRIPIFMYLSDYREVCLKDVITRLEPRLFKKVTGLEVADFNLLCSLDLFNSSLMNTAVYNFKRYEDASFSYAGLVSAHSADENVGLFDTVLTQAEYRALFEAQQQSLL